MVNEFGDDKTVRAHISDMGLIHFPTVIIYLLYFLIEHSKKGMLSRYQLNPPGNIPLPVYAGRVWGMDFHSCIPSGTAISK
jgi:hypothetical protein